MVSDLHPVFSIRIYPLAPYFRCRSVGQRSHDSRNVLTYDSAYHYHVHHHTKLHSASCRHEDWLLQRSGFYGLAGCRDNLGSYLDAPHRPTTWWPNIIQFNNCDHPHDTRKCLLVRLSCHTMVARQTRSRTDHATADLPRHQQLLCVRGMCLRCTSLQFDRILPSPLLSDRSRKKSFHGRRVHAGNCGTSGYRLLRFRPCH